MSISNAVLSAGFANPVTDSQAAFRAILDALAEPGAIRALAGVAGAPEPLSAVAAAAALTLCDADTPVWLGQGLAASSSVKGWFAFHCGSPLVTEPSEAAFAFCHTPEILPALEMFAQGTQEYPDRSATLILQVASFEGGERLALSGPGIPGSREIAPMPMPKRFPEQWRQNHGRFPRGLDVVLAGPQGVCGLPRTTRIAMEG